MGFFLEILRNTVSFLLSIGLIAFVAFVFKEWIKRFIDHTYKLSESKASIESQFKLEFLKYQVPMMIELTQIIYKSRSYAGVIIKNRTALVPEKEDYSQCVSFLTEKLFAYRVLLDADIFDMLHQFKRLAQDLLMHLDISDRPENLRGGILYFSEELQTKLNDLYLKMDELYQRISTYFQEKYRIDQE